MLEYAQEAHDMASGHVCQDLDSDRKLNLALVRLLEIMGEAAARMPTEEQRRLPEIPWPQIIGLRNRLIHGYDAADFDILWQVTTGDLPALIGVLKRILGRS